MRRPARIVAARQAEIDTLKVEILVTAPPRYHGIIKSTKAYVTDTVRGRSRYCDRTVTVPSWVFLRRSKDYQHWYLAHELAHQIAREAGSPNGHGEVFMNILQHLTPYAHHELGYKPKLAAAAGIKEIA